MAADGSVIIQIDGDESKFKKALSSLKGITATAVKGVTTAIAGIGGAFAAAGAAAIKFGSEYETSLAKVATLADTSVKSIDELSGEIINLSNKTGAAATELNEALYQAISAGADTAHATELVETAVKAAKGGFTDTETAVDGLTSALNAYGMATTEAESLANQFLITQNLGKTTFGALSSSIGNVAPTAKAAGVEISELLASVAALTSNGTPTSAAMTSMKAALSNIIKPTSEASKMAQQLGIDFSAAALQSKGWSGFLAEIKEKTGGSTEQMAQLFGSVEALNAILALTSDDGMELMDKALGEMATNTTALDDAFQTMDQTLGSTTQKIGTNLKNLGISIYQSVDGPVNDVADNALSMVQQLQQAFSDGGLKGLIEGLGGVLADAAVNVASAAPDMIDAAAQAIDALLTGLSKNAPKLAQAGAGILTSLIKGLSTVLPRLVETAGQVVSSLASALAEALPTLIPMAYEAIINIVSALVENIPLLVDAALQLIQGLADGLLNAAPVVYNAIPGLINGLVSAVLDAIPTIIQAGVKLLTSLIGALPEIVTTVVAAIPKIIDGVLSAVFESIPLIVDAGIELLIALVQALPEIITTIVAAIPKIISSIIGAVLGNIPLLVKAGIQLLVALVSALPEIINGIVSAVPEIIGAFIDAFLGFAGDIANIGKDIVMGIWDGISGSAKWLLDKVGGWAGGILDGIKGFFGIHSPSKVMRDEVGKMLVLGVAQGIAKTAPKSVTAVEELSNDMLHTAEERTKNYEAIGERYIDQITEGVEQKREESLAAFRGLVDEQFAAYKNEAGKLEGTYKEAADFLVDTYTEALDNGYDEALVLVKDRMGEIASEYQNQYDEIIRKQDSLQSALSSDFGGLFTFDDNTVKLENIDRSISQIEQYNELLTQLRDEYGATDAFLAEITSLGADDGLRAAKKLVGLDAEQFGAYQEKWLEKQRLAQEVAQQFYAGQLETLDQEFTQKMDGAIGEIPAQLEDIGRNSMQGWIDGMNGMLPSLESAARGIANRVISSMRDAMDIHSPSRKMATLVGAPTAEGIGVGFEQAYPQVMARMRNAVDAEMARASARLEAVSAGLGAGAVTKEVTNNKTVVDRVIRLDVTSDSDGEFVRWLRGKIRAEDDRIGLDLAGV